MTEPGPGPADRITVRFQAEGGFAHIPGLSRALILDTDVLDPEDSERLRGLLDGAGFFARPEQAETPSPGAADYRTYTITATRGGRSHSIRLIDPVSDPRLRDLVDQLIEWEHRARSS